MAAEFGKIFNSVKNYFKIPLNGFQQVGRVVKNTIRRNNSFRKLCNVNKVTFMFAALQCNTKRVGSDGDQVSPVFTNVPSEVMIRDAYATTMEAISQLVKFSSAAVIDANQEYRKALNVLVELLVQVLESDDSSLDLDDQLIASKSKMLDAKKVLEEMYTKMDSVSQLALKMSEISFLAGAESTSLTMAARLNGAYIMITVEREKTQKLEKVYLQLQIRIISHAMEPVLFSTAIEI